MVRIGCRWATQRFALSWGGSAEGTLQERWLRAFAAVVHAADQVVCPESAQPVQATELIAQVGEDHHLPPGLASLHRRTIPALTYSPLRPPPTPHLLR